MEQTTKMETKIDKMYCMIQTLAKDMGDVKRVLKGDDYGTKGLVESHKNLKHDFSNVKDDVKKAKIVGGVIVTILGALIAFFKK